MEECRLAGINDVIIDPGFGFGKTQEQNFELLRNLGEFKTFGLPLLAGISRKRMVQHATGANADESLHGTTAANMAALMNGACVLRVHDVAAAMQAVKIFIALNQKQGA